MPKAAGPLYCKGSGGGGGGVVGAVRDGPTQSHGCWRNEQDRGSSAPSRERLRWHAGRPDRARRCTAV